MIWPGHGFDQNSLLVPSLGYSQSEKSAQIMSNSRDFFILVKQLLWRVPLVCFQSGWYKPSAVTIYVGRCKPHVGLCWCISTYVGRCLLLVNACKTYVGRAGVCGLPRRVAALVAHGRRLTVWEILDTTRFRPWDGARPKIAQETLEQSI